MGRTRDSGTDDPGPAPSAEEALARARRHARAAAGEGLEAVRALLEAAALATPGVPSGAQRLLSLASDTLEELAAALGAEDRATQASLGRALTEALDAEIARWEARARDDTEARAVLRAFLGLREVLWELGMRPERGARPRGAKRAHTRRKVERVPVQG
jgi:hypothetical protein